MADTAKPILNPDIDAIREEVEQLAGKTILWEADADLEARMRATLEADTGQLRITYREFSQDGALEELLHLRLRLRGCPRLDCHPNLGLTTQTHRIIEGIVHHQVVFPEIHALGYRPNEDNGILMMLNELTSSTDLDRVTDERGLEALMAMTYTRSRLDTDSEDIQRRYDDFFSDSRLHEAKTLGERVCHIVLSRASNQPDAIRDVYEQCIEALGVEIDIVD